MLELLNISVTLGKGSVLERKVLENLNLNVVQGEFIVIIGGNGAGKSTMFNVISGYIKQDHGKIMLANKDISNESQYSRSGLIAKVMQEPKMGTMENMTILENMAFAYMRGISRGLLPYDNAKRRELYQEKLSMLKMGLENRLDELVINLSGGQRQALSLIMAIIADSKILLLDEITAALDPKSAENIMRITNAIVKEEKRTTIMITHNMLHAARYGTRTLLLDNGKITKEFVQKDKEQLSLICHQLDINELEDLLN